VLFLLVSFFYLLISDIIVLIEEDCLMQQYFALIHKIDTETANLLTLIIINLGL